MERISKNKYKIDKHSNRNDNKEKKKLTTKQKVIIVLSIIVSIFAIFAIQIDYAFCLYISIKYEIKILPY